MVGLVALTSGAVVAGLGVYRYLLQNARTFQPKPVAITTPAAPPLAGPEQIAAPSPLGAVTAVERSESNAVPHMLEISEELQRGFNSSTLSLGLASTGLLFPPLQYASVPVLIYMGAPAARRAYDRLAEKGKPSRALLETTVLAICLGGGWYWVGSLGFWLYYLSRIARHNYKLTEALCDPARALPASARLLNAGEAVVVPVDTLQLGDEVLVETSDVVPVAGVIAHGAAWVQPAGTSDIAAYCLRRTGDQVQAADVVIAGRIAIRVQKTAQALSTQ